MKNRSWKRLTTNIWISRKKASGSAGMFSRKRDTIGKRMRKYPLYSFRRKAIGTCFLQNENAPQKSYRDGG
jgi:hypothetical protein